MKPPYIAIAWVERDEEYYPFLVAEFVYGTITAVLSSDFQLGPEATRIGCLRWQVPIRRLARENGVGFIPYELEEE